jgi:hypothetical protein
MQGDLEERFGSRLELHKNQRAELEDILLPWARPFYETIAKTLFEVLRLIQPEHFEGGDKVNFYFLPGYHSHLIDKRIFYRCEPPELAGLPYRDFGVGLCGDSRTALDVLELYHDCSQIRWYYRATMPPYGESEFRPGSPYHWYINQQPRISDEPHHMVASFTFSTIESISEDREFPEHKVLNLAELKGNSKEWGTKVAEKLNSTPKLRDPGWEFPDRRDRASDSRFDPKRERDLRRVRCMLISLWMHSVFNSEEPDWWDDLIQEIDKHQLTGTRTAISEGREDNVACEWGDRSCGRPGFTTWTTICLHNLVAPPPVPWIGPRDHLGHMKETAAAVYKHNIGWATILCSAPLSISFISVARQWIRTVYGTLRNAEVSVLLRNRESLERAAQMVRALTHDTHKFMQESVDTVLREIEDSSLEVVAYRRFVLLALRAQTYFTNAAVNAIPDPMKQHRLRGEFVEFLLKDPKHLTGALYRVALDVQKYRTRTHRARVEVPEHLAIPLPDIPFDTYASCLLLVGEIVRNYCDHGPPNEVARLAVIHDNGRLEIILEGRGEAHSVGVNFALLHNVLETLRLGRAEFRKTGENCFWSIIIYLIDQEL